ncbi:MAG TPA: hypothetical protein VGW78_06705 [Candidatus Babeliales bacterium]|jgi:hypothetical protein|nr:hypothetical protein [Candidatus Babeliales bacterium]
MNKLLLTLLILSGLMLNPILYAEQNTKEETECTTETNSIPERVSIGAQLLPEIKKLAEVATAIGTGILAYEGTWKHFCYFASGPVISREGKLAFSPDQAFGAGVYTTILLAGSAVMFYLLQKTPKEIMKMIGRNYDVLTFNTIMGLTITNLFTLTLLNSSKK